jgi:diguanylate cyclase (GGDEF)-like protein
VNEVLVGGRPDAAFGTKPLPPSPGPITFRFAALTFADESAVRFRYRLAGLADAWSEAAPGQFETTWGGLPAGAYRFEVTARTADGRAARSPAVVAFRVRAPWWRTPAALVLFFAAALGGFVAFVRSRERRLVRTRARLERQVAARTEALREANERLAALAITDELTGLANRRRILARLDEAISFARRTRTALAIGIADLDRFKEINDTRGHAFGDRTLVLAARAMEGVLRTEDLLGRYGGEEFLVVLPGTDGPGAVAAGERMRQALTSLPEEARAGMPLTVSVGIAVYDDPQLEVAELLRRADAALYAAKANGRDRVESWNRV